MRLLGSRGPGSERSGDRSSLRDQGTDAVQLVLDYVKQETFEPLRGVGRFLIFGIVGSVTLCMGVGLLLLGLLRLLQTETGTTFAGDLTWVPYCIVALVTMALIGIAIWRVTAGLAAPRRPVEEDLGPDIAKQLAERERAERERAERERAESDREANR